VYILPLFTCAVGAAPAVVHQIHNAVTTFVCLVTASYLLNRASIIIDVTFDALHSAGEAVRAYGWIPFTVALWCRMLLPAQLLVFWLGLLALQLYRLWWAEGEPSSVPLLSGVLLCVAECCTTPLAFIGACVTQSYLANGVIVATRKFLGNPYVDCHRGVTEGLMMFLVGVQSSLVVLERPKRVFLTTVVLFMAFSSLLQSVYELVESVLLALAVSQSRQFHLHLRAVLVCLFLIFCPLLTVHLVWQNYDVDFWSIIVTSMCVLTSLQAVGSLLIYGLLVHDNFMIPGSKLNPFDSADRMIYGVKSGVRLVELVIAIIFTGYSLERSVVGSCSWMNASIIAVHCYFNIWTRLQTGWLDFMQRREATKQLMVMPTATAFELCQNNDVCTICYQEMDSGCDSVVRVTTCRHFFHDVCLRKWLFVQDFCPICSNKIMHI
jgi:TRC8 N-terminal domain/Ring finger domain